MSQTPPHSARRPNPEQVDSPRRPAWLRRLWLVCRAAVAGFFGYGAAAVMLAFVVVQFFPTRHPHAMDEMLYFIFPLFLAPAGAVAGIVTALLVKSGDIWKILKIMGYVLIFLAVGGSLAALFA